SMGNLRCRLCRIGIYPFAKGIFYFAWQAAATDNTSMGICPHSGKTSSRVERQRTGEDLLLYSETCNDGG
ncbi:hypothetical protein, partial [Akkermansia sp.]